MGAACSSSNSAILGDNAPLPATKDTILAGKDGDLAGNRPASSTVTRDLGDSRVGTPLAGPLKGTMVLPDVPLPRNLARTPPSQKRQIEHDGEERASARLFVPWEQPALGSKPSLKEQTFIPGSGAEKPFMLAGQNKKRSCKNLLPMNHYHLATTTITITVTTTIATTLTAFKFNTRYSHFTTNMSASLQR
jgi:hypothetical protein